MIGLGFCMEEESGQFEDDALHRLIPKWCYDKTPRLNVRGEFGGNGVIEDAGDCRNVNSKAGKHGDYNVVI
jgi:hypothetical protein